MRSTSNSSRNNIHTRLSLGAVMFSLLLAIFVFGSAALASKLTAPSDGPLAQATSTVPQPAGTAQVPSAVNTAEGVSPAIVTGAAPDAQLTANAGIPTQPGGSVTGNNPSATNTATASSSSFPWLPLLLVVVVVVLLVLAFVIMRTRRSTVTTVGAPVGPIPPATPVASMPATTTTTTTTAATPTSTTAPVAPSTLAAAAPVVAAAPVSAATAAALPKTLTCPNCSTVNDWSENFCHECGQDLRPVRAGIIAAAAPPTDIVTDDMPYLETLDRSDEQLEYVLSRKKIVVGTAPGNDIVIDSAFTGHDTVSPRHAELRREGDGFLLVDLNSENGTYVNDARTGENLLAEGDQIRFGSVRFVYRVP